MQNLLQELIETGNPQLIQKYVSKYLPNDHDNLQRIYNQLTKYQPPKINENKQKTQVRQIKKIATKKVLQTPAQSSIRKSKSLMSVLRQKGIKPQTQGFQNGVVIAEKQRDKFMKPLKMNPIAPFLKKGKVNQLCQKYQINKQFYQNPPAGFDIDQFGFDPQMHAFIQKRKSLFKTIQQKKLNHSQSHRKSKKYQSIQSKINLKRSQNLTNSQFPSLKLSSQQFISKQSVKRQTKDIIDKCNSFQKIKNGMDNINNVFTQLQYKIFLQDNIDIDKVLKTKVKQSLVGQKLQRYNLAYMTYLKKKNDYRSMSSYKKQLLKDQIKMRGIVNFQD